MPSIRGPLSGDSLPGKSDRAVFTAYLHLKHPEAVAREVRTILHIMHRRAEHRLFEQVLEDTLGLYAGEYPGYQACNTDYHDLTHTLDVLLATARLAHGAHVEGVPFTPAQMDLALAAALLHDVGYIQSLEDGDGTGAKYTLTHVRRSVEFAGPYLAGLGLDPVAVQDCQSLIWSTDLGLDVGDLAFSSPQASLLGRMVATADLVGQTADDIYLEKLADLYTEFMEGEVPGFPSEWDLVRKTLDFFTFIQGRLRGQLGGLCQCLRAHFRARHSLDRDLYAEYMHKNIFFLDYTLRTEGEGYRSRLRRSRRRSREAGDILAGAALDERVQALRT